MDLGHNLFIQQVQLFQIQNIMLVEELEYHKTQLLLLLKQEEMVEVDLHVQLFLLQERVKVVLLILVVAVALEVLVEVV